MAFSAALLAAIGLSVTFTMAADASGGGSTTDVHFLSLAPPFKLFTNHAFAANSSFSAVVIGGSTTVPSNATTVELDLTAGGASSGVMNIVPAGASGGSGQFLEWGAGSSNSQTIEENVGTKDELTFALQGGAAKATATIIGYSTQVTDGDISGLDGNTGQVLTDNGSGASWENPSVGSGGISGAGGSAGQVLTNNGSGGAVWQGSSVDPATGWTQASGGGIPIETGSPTNETTVASVTLPAGSYYLSFDGTVTAGATSTSVSCEIWSPQAGTIDGSELSVAAGQDSTMAIQGLSTSAAGTFTVRCEAGASEVQVGFGNFPTFDAIAVSSQSVTPQ
jgi:hypothetical protein